MIVLDSDVMVDLLRQHPPAVVWFDSLDEEEELLLPGYVVMELIQGCRNRSEQDRLERHLARYGVVWPSRRDCDRALAVLVDHHLSHGGACSIPLSAIRPGH